MDAATQEQHGGEDLSLSASLSQRGNRNGEDVREKSRTRGVWGQQSPDDSLQGEEGVLCPLGLLVGAPGGTGWVSGVSSGGRRGGVCGLGSLLQKPVKLCRNNQAKAHWLGMKNRNNYTHGSCWDRHTFAAHPFLCGVPFLVERKKRVISSCLSSWQTSERQNSFQVAFHASLHHAQGKETSGAQSHIIHVHLTTVRAVLECASVTSQ